MQIHLLWAEASVSWAEGGNLGSNRREAYKEEETLENMANVKDLQKVLLSSSPSTADIGAGVRS